MTSEDERCCRYECVGPVRRSGRITAWSWPRARDPREGAFKEILGTYNPRTKPAKVEIDRERLNHWIKQGARPSDSVRTLIARHLTKDRSAVSRAGDG